MDLTFELCISLDNYTQKPSREECRNIRFQHKTVTTDEFLNLVCDGYVYTALMKDNWRNGDNFICTNLITFDIDHSDVSMNDYVEGLEIKPTVAYTSSRNGVEGYGYGFRLVYFADEAICTLEDYAKLSSNIAKELSLKFVDDRSFKGDQMWFGSYGCETYVSNNILKMECKKWNATHLDGGCSKYNNKSIPNKSISKTITIHTYHNSLSDTFQRDYETMSYQDIIKKYRTTFDNIEKTPIVLNEDVPLIKYPSNYYEIRRPWKKINGETMKIKDGEGRRRKLYLNGIIRRKINPNISFDNLLYNLIYEFEYYYINDGNKIDKKTLYEIANNVMKAEIMESDLGKPRNKSFVNPLYCAKYNMKPKEVLGQVKNKKQYIGEFYDPLLTDKENIDVMNEHGFDISIITLKRWKKENNIKKYNKTNG